MENLLFVALGIAVVLGIAAFIKYSGKKTPTGKTGGGGAGTSKPSDESQHD